MYPTCTVRCRFPLLRKSVCSAKQCAVIACTSVVLQRTAYMHFQLGSWRGEGVMRAAVTGNIHLVFPAHGCHFVLFVPGTAAVTEYFSAQCSAACFDISILVSWAMKNRCRGMLHRSSLPLLGAQIIPPPPTPGPRIALRSELMIKANHCHESFRKVDGGK